MDALHPVSLPIAIEPRSLDQALITLVLPPDSRWIWCTLLPFHLPIVKSGMAIAWEPLATDHSLSGPTTLHAAASYTSISTGNPFRRQSINRQSIIKSIPP